MYKRITNYRKKVYEREKYCTNDRLPYYDIANIFLPKSKNSKIVDIGCGYCDFSNHLKLEERYDNVYLLDSNEDTKRKFNKIILYTAPNILPFSDKVVDFIHISHLIEHLYPEDLKSFFDEVNRVLKIDGVLVISAPILWDKFYGNLSHIKPYNPKVLINYFCKKEKDRKTADPTFNAVSTNYIVEKIVYRYFHKESNFGSKYFVIDIFIEIYKKIFIKLGFRNYQRTGFTIVLRKKENN